MAEGKVGAPLGNNNGQKNRVWSLALEKALENRSKGDQMKSLIELANALIAKCLEGDMVALKELGDRIEGKPLQSIHNFERTIDIRWQAISRSEIDRRNWESNDE